MSNLVVMLCGTKDEDLPDAYGPFENEDTAKAYLTEKHGKTGWNDEADNEVEPECFGGVFTADHAIVEMFK